MHKLIKIWSKTCNPCLNLNEHFNKVNDKYPLIEIENIELTDTIKKEYNVIKIPLLILYEDTKEISRFQNSNINNVLDWLSMIFNDNEEDF